MNNVGVALSSLLTITETLQLALANAGKENVVFDGHNTVLVMNATTTPPALQHATFQAALTAGAATIDLTALPGTQGTVVGTGQKVRACFFRNPATNANPITIKFGAANPYLLLGAAWSMVLTPGQFVGPIYLKDGAPAIDATHKNIDLSGTGAQALDCVIVLG